MLALLMRWPIVCRLASIIIITVLLPGCKCIFFLSTELGYCCCYTYVRWCRTLDACRGFDPCNTEHAIIILMRCQTACCSIPNTLLRCTFYYRMQTSCMRSLIQSVTWPCLCSEFFIIDFLLVLLYLSYAFMIVLMELD